MDDSPFDLVNWLCAAAGSAATALWTWLRQRKREATEIKATEIENVEKAITIWRGLAEDMRRQVDELRIEVDHLRKEVSKMHEENEDLREQVGNLQMENQRLNNQLNKIQG